MKKIVFVDHGFHRKTKSSAFFIDVLRNRFDVEILYLSPEGVVGADVLEASARADLVVLWQMDFLAPVFLAQGKPTIVIPMYDGSGGQGELHWLMAKGARQINFSLAMHHRVRMLGCPSLLARYFPEPVAEEDLPRFDTLSAFFWQRRPDEGIDVDLVDALLGTEIDALHVHAVADVPWSVPVRAHGGRAYALSTSHWLPAKSDYAALLARANTFIAPRRAEGIGMALLEAMARGMLVIAHDEPTHNEYVSNWVNGVLFNLHGKPGSLPVRHQAATLGRMAWETVREGHRQWLASIPALLDWIDTAPTPTPVSVDLEALLLDAWFSYYASPDEYTAFLRRNVALMAKLSGLSFSQVADALRHRDGVDAGRAPSRQVPPDPTAALLAQEQAELRAQVTKANQERLLLGARLKAAERALAATDAFPLATQLPPYSLPRRLSAALGFARGQLPSVRSLVKQADARRDAGEWTQAAELYERALAANPRRGSIWVQLGNMRKEAGRFDLAAQAYQRALRCIPRDPDLYVQIGHLRKLMGNPRGAQEAYQAALACNRNHREAEAELQVYAREAGPTPA